MRICSANLHSDPALASESPTAYLERMPLLSEVPAALATAGHQVDVVQAFATEETFTSRGVTYHFVRPSPLEGGLARAAGWGKGRELAQNVPAARAVRRVLELEPDVVHFHGLTLGASLALLERLRGDEMPAIVAQYYGQGLSDGWLASKMQAAGLRQVERVLFANLDGAEPFLRAGLLEERQLAEVADRSTSLVMKARPEARLVTGMRGSPVFLWYDDLEPQREPMTAVLSLENVLGWWPNAQLYLYYDSDRLLTQIRAYVVANPNLADRVHFRSRALNHPPEAIFNSADFLLQTDRLADRGQAVMEAMACGVIPIVSDIPRYRRMVDFGRCGILFPQGDAATLANNLLPLSRGQIAGRAALVHDWFDAAFSYEAMAGLLLDVYTEAVAERRLALEDGGSGAGEQGSEAGEQGSEKAPADD